ncbi:MAG: LPP20 family lipoprotein [Candidatus Kryptonium sp.]
MRYLTPLILIFAVALFVAGCGGAKERVAVPEAAPAWVNTPPTAVDAIYAVGAANVGANPVLARNKAADAARQELGRIIQVKVKSLLDNFMQEHQEFINTQGTVTSEEFTRSVSRSVSQATLAGSQIVEYYYDKDNKIYYALAVLRKNDIVNEIMRSMNEAQRQKKTAFVEMKADEALKLLDKELEKWDLSK